MGPVSKPTKRQTPKKRKSDKAATSQAPPNKQKKPARRLILQCSSDTPPRSPTPEIPICSHSPSPPPITIPVSIPPIFPIPTTQPFTTIPIPTPNFTDTTTTTGAHFTTPNQPVTIKPPVTIEPQATSKSLYPTQSTETTPILGGEDLEFDSTYFSPYRLQSDDNDDEPVTKHHLKCQQASLAVDASTKECREVTVKVDKLVSEAHLFLDSLQAASAKNAQIVNASVENLQRCTLQLKLQNHKLRTASAEVNDLKSKREVIRSSATDVHSILLHLIEARYPIITITIMRHLADKLRPALDILSRIEGVPVTGSVMPGF
ncbi:unnamed protein product [Lactuca saligna]|uniref:Uncharacterized protein n=1 Tax=Lactuca saligna TaxID=75948 RepID=A0AA35XXX3_LACSI|nr:unnamed protein product [Lactuca saligna]